jgi:hypothetical protein
VSWAEIGALAAIVAVFEAPMIAIGVLMWQWVKSVNERLARIEQRSHQRRRTDWADKV